MATPTSSYIFLIKLFTISITFFNKIHPATSQPLFPAILVFGDSTVDTGNNNHITSIASLNRADHKPYGRDFQPTHLPTGRFSNGRLIPDFMASILGLKDNGVPPFLDPYLSDDELLTGVSFASAGSGFDDLTGLTTGSIPVLKQIEYFRKYVEKIKRVVGDDNKVKEILKNALVVVSAGSNDFAFNFYDLPTRRIQFDISRYQDFILKRLQTFLEDLYDQGCRTVIVSGLPPVGCLPIQITAKFKNPNARTCLDDQNVDARAYNQKLQKLLPQIQSSLPGTRLFYADTYTPLVDRITQPKRFDVKVTDRGCCGTGFLEVGRLCNQLTPTCKNASEYVFWDSTHPTETTYQYIFAYLIQDIGSQLIGGDDDNHLPKMSM